MYLCDPAAERAVLSGMFRYGNDIYLDICDYVKASSFTIDSNKLIFNALVHGLKQDESVKFDIPTILNSAKILGYTHIIERKEELEHLNSITKLLVEKANVRKFAGKVRKLEIARLMHDQMGTAQEKLKTLDGTEAIANIIGIAEDVVFDFSSLIDGANNNPDILGKFVLDYVKYLRENPVDQIGISSGFKRWDHAIGGGLRGKTLNVICARPKSGKTFLVANMGIYIAGNKVPFLNLDTEMSKEDQIIRSLGILSQKVELHDIERGKFGQNPHSDKLINESANKLTTIPYYYKSISGQAFEETLALIRRWIIKEVGLKTNGYAKPCVIAFDYLKLMDSTGISNGNLQEYQLLGFMCTSLHNLAVRYDIPIVCFVQSTRDGIDKETTAVAAGSDRIVWLCSNLTLLKRKSDEEIAEDGPECGSRKLVVLACRHGEGMEPNDYISVKAQLKYGLMQEGLSKFEIASGKKENTNDLSIIDDDGKQIPFE